VILHPPKNSNSFNSTSLENVHKMALREFQHYKRFPVPSCSDGSGILNIIHNMKNKK
jgi:hypothetical protein